MEARTPDRSRIASTNDEDPSIVWFAEECRSNHVRFEALLRLAERVRDPELGEFFARAEAVSSRISSVPA
jgi:hypothetical protein